jgi:tetratricopeptide (TPR) repeat protein
VDRSGQSLRSRTAMFLVVLILSTLFLWDGCTESGDVSLSRVPQSGALDGLNLQNRLGEQHLRSREYDLALKAFQEALAGTEDSVRAYSGLSRTYLARRNSTLAEVALRQATSVDSTRAEVFYTRAGLYLDRHLKTPQGPLLEQALAAARQAARLAPDQKDYFYVLGNLYTHRGDLDSAEVAYQQALVLDAHLAAAYERLGNLYKYQGRSAEAEKAYQKQLELQPENAQALCELAALYRADGRLAAARESLEKAVRLDTGLVGAYLNLGQLYLAEGRTEAGKKALKRFQELNENDTAILLAEAEARPRDIETQLRLVRAFTKDGGYLEAERLYLKIIQLDNSLMAAYTGLGSLYLLQRRFEEAENTLQQGRQRNPSGVAVYTLLGEVYLLQNRFNMAVQTLEKATELDPGRPRSYDLLASAYQQSGQYQKERRAREWAKKLKDEGGL